LKSLSDGGQESSAIKANLAERMMRTRLRLKGSRGTDYRRVTNTHLEGHKMASSVEAAVILSLVFSLAEKHPGKV